MKSSKAHPIRVGLLRLPPGSVSNDWFTQPHRGNPWHFRSRKMEFEPIAAIATQQRAHMPREFDVFGLGNALVDILLETDRRRVRAARLREGDDAARRAAPSSRRCSAGSATTSRGWSAAGRSPTRSSPARNSAAGARSSAASATTAMACTTQTEFDELGIDFGNPPLVGETTGTCVSIITPDAERTMRTCLAVSSHLAARHVDAERIAVGRVAVRRGLRLRQPGHRPGRHPRGHPAGEGRTARRSPSPARRRSSSQVFGDAFREALAQSDLLFCNATEAWPSTGGSDAAEAFAKLKGMVPAAVVTDGPNGAFVRHGGRRAHVPAFPCEPKDLTGAGDMFAGAFLYGITHGIAPEKAARAANLPGHEGHHPDRRRLHHGREAVLGELCLGFGVWCFVWS